MNENLGFDTQAEMFLANLMVKLFSPGLYINWDLEALRD